MRISTFLKGAAALAIIAATPALAQAQQAPPPGVKITSPGDSQTSRVVNIGLNKSTIVELSTPAADVVITNPAIADATVQTSQRIIFRGVKAGQTNALIFDRNGNELLSMEINVERDMAMLDDLIVRHVPDARVNIEAVNGGIVLTGNVDNLAQQDQVMRLVKAYMAEGDTVPPIVSMLNMAAKDQVMLEVRIVEMQRSVVKQLGINLSGTTSFGDLASQSLQALFGANGLPLFFDADQTIIAADGTTTVIAGLGQNTQGVGTALEGIRPDLPFSNSVGFTSSNNFNVAGGSLGGLSTNVGYTNLNNGNAQSRAGAAIDALERIGVVRTLAEPNITTISGESAKFLAGGEFPVPVAQDQDGRVTVEFKPYGVGLAFTPVVLTEGRISLKVSTEVSELTSVGAFQGSSVAGVDADGNVITASGLTIPALTVRRAESTVEMPSGGSMMLAGLIQSRTRQTLDQLPGIKKLPVLGALFQSRDFLNEETELIIMITPYLVDPTRKSELVTPADGYANASDSKTIFFGKLNAMYGKPGEGPSADEYRAPVGFIEE